MAFYRVCPLCGCNLDPGEPCDCQEEKKKQENYIERHTKVEKSRQMAFVFDGAGYENKVVV